MKNTDYTALRLEMQYQSNSSLDDRENPNSTLNKSINRVISQFRTMNVDPSDLEIIKIAKNIVKTCFTQNNDIDNDKYKIVIDDLFQLLTERKNDKTDELEGSERAQEHKAYTNQLNGLASRMNDYYDSIDVPPPSAVSTVKQEKQQSVSDKLLDYIGVNEKSRKDPKSSSKKVIDNILYILNQIDDKMADYEKKIIGQIIIDKYVKKHTFGGQRYIDNNVTDFLKTIKDVNVSDFCIVYKETKDEQKTIAICNAIAGLSDNKDLNDKAFSMFYRYTYHYDYAQGESVRNIMLGLVKELLDDKLYNFMHYNDPSDMKTLLLMLNYKLEPGIITMLRPESQDALKSFKFGCQSGKIELSHTEKLKIQEKLCELYGEKSKGPGM